MQSTSMIRVSKMAKIKKLAGSYALQLAKQRNDPLYKKAMKFRKKWKDAIEQIQKKYGMKGMQSARQAAMKKN